MMNVQFSGGINERRRQNQENVIAKFFSYCAILEERIAGQEPNIFHICQESINRWEAFFSKIGVFSLEIQEKIAYFRGVCGANSGNLLRTLYGILQEYDMQEKLIEQEMMQEQPPIGYVLNTNQVGYTTTFNDSGIVLNDSQSTNNNDQYVNAEEFVEDGEAERVGEEIEENMVETGGELEEEETVQTEGEGAVGNDNEKVNNFVLQPMPCVEDKNESDSSFYSALCSTPPGMSQYHVLAHDDTFGSNGIFCIDEKVKDMWQKVQVLDYKLSHDDNANLDKGMQLVETKLFPNILGTLIKRKKVMSQKREVSISQMNPFETEYGHQEIKEFMYPRKRIATAGFKGINTTFGPHTR